MIVAVMLTHLDGPIHVEGLARDKLLLKGRKALALIGLNKCLTRMCPTIKRPPLFHGEVDVEVRVDLLRQSIRR